MFWTKSQVPYFINAISSAEYRLKHAISKKGVNL
jgi:hypothetical protein